MRNALKGKIICFIGIDGSGKTTLAKLFCEKLKKHNIPCRFTYGRYFPLFSRPFVFFGKTLFLGTDDIKKYSQYSFKKQEVAKRYNITIKIYTAVVVFDYLIQVLFKIILPKKMGKTIICDRYLFDTVINDIPRQDNNIESLKKMIDAYFLLIPKPDIVFLIDIPENIAFERKNDTPSIDYLIEKREIYQKSIKKYGFKSLDGCKTQEDLIKNITEDVFHDFNNKIT